MSIDEDTRFPVRGVNALENSNPLLIGVRADILGHYRATSCRQWITRRFCCTSQKFRGASADDRIAMKRSNEGCVSINESRRRVDAEGTGCIPAACASVKSAMKAPEASVPSCLSQG